MDEIFARMKDLPSEFNGKEFDIDVTKVDQDTREFLNTYMTNDPFLFNNQYVRDPKLVTSKGTYGRYIDEHKDAKSIEIVNRHLNEPFEWGDLIGYDQTVGRLDPETFAGQLKLSHTVFHSN